MSNALALLENNKTSLSKWFVVIYLVLKPFYFLESGLPQIADVLILFVLIPFSFSLNIKNLIKETQNRYLLLFCLLVIIVNTSYFITDTSSGYQISYIYSTVYYGFNVLLFYYCLDVFKTFTKKDFLYLIYAILLVLIFEFIWLLLGYNKEVEENFFNRAYLSFNNPNQLAYYALLLCSLLLIIVSKYSFKKYLISIILSMALLLIISATSRPAIIGMIVLVLLYYLKLCRWNKFKELIVFTIPIAIFLVFNSSKIYSEIARIETRFAKISYTSKTDVVERGIDKMYEYPMKLIYGAGEGNNARFLKNLDLLPSEIHSSIGALWFSYGVLGLLFFVLFCFTIIKRKSTIYLWILLPIFFYNLFHNGLRFSLLWIFLALFKTISDKYITPNISENNKIGN